MASDPNLFANTVSYFSNIILVIGVIFTLAGTMGSIWSSGQKEKFADERISHNKAETEKAHAEAAKANENAARLQREAEQARLEIVKLNQKMAWRRLSSNQYQILVNELKKNTFTEVWLTFVGDDPESITFREDINRAFSEAGIEAKFYSGYKVAVGLSIKGPDGKEKDALRSAFAEAGLQLDEGQGDSLHNGKKLEITVGTKPPPF